MTARPTRRMSAARTATRPAQRPGISRWKLYTMMAVAGAVLVTGTFVAARQHFLSWDYGMKNSRLRKQIDELETEKRRLLLARENSSSPSEIKRVVKKFGLSDAPTVANSSEQASAKLPVSAPAAARVTRTADSKPVTFAVVPASLKTAQPASKPAGPRPARTERETRRELAE